MDRREFGKLSLGTVAAGAVAPLAHAQAQETPLPRSIAQLPADLRALMSQSFPKFSDAEYARRERLLGQVMEKADVDHIVVVTWQREMCMVVQPNVITRDKTAGVQVGEMVRVTKTGFETLHNMPRGLFRSGQVV
jgi:hypothetical protein